MKMKKALCLILLAAMLLSGVSCSNEAAADETTAQTAAAETQPVETEYHYYDHIEARDLGGMEFRIISRMTAKGHDVQVHTDYGNDEIDAQELDGTPINDTVYNRNRELETRYNFTYQSIQFDTNPMETVKTSVLAGSDDYDAVVDSLRPMSQYNLFRRYDDLQYIDMSADCWDHNATDSLSVWGDHYVLIGDMLTLDKKGTWCVLFNKGLAADYQVGNMYDMVREGTWTFDTFRSIVELGAFDLDGDGKMTESDRWGLLGEGFNTNIFMFGGEVRISVKDDKDYPVLSAYTDRSVALFEKVFALLDNRELTMHLDWAKGGPSATLTAFSEDRGLFYMTGIGTAMEYRYMDTDFGILPVPKFDEAQNNYYTSLSTSNSAAIAIPKSCGSADDAAFVLQATCLASTDTLQKAFYETVLTGVTARDEESGEMLDILFAGRVFDLAFIQRWGDLFGLFSGLVNSRSSDLTSKYQKMEAAANQAIADAMTEYADMN